MVDFNSDTIFTIGILYLGYLTLKSWNIIGMNSTNINNLKPLTEQNSITGY